MPHRETVLSRTISRTVRRAIYGAEADPFRVGNRLAAYPCRRADQYLVLSIEGRPIGMNGLLWHYCEINGTEERMGGFGGLCVRRELRGSGLGADLVRQTLALLGGTVGVLAFCEPRLVAYYERLGGTLVTLPITVHDRQGQEVQSPQPILWWGSAPLRSCTLRSARW